MLRHLIGSQSRLTVMNGSCFHINCNAKVQLRIDQRWKCGNPPCDVEINRQLSHWHHKVELGDTPRLMSNPLYSDANNWHALCANCHTIKSAQGRATFSSLVDELKAEQEEENM